jgi:hypothetical protein
MLQEAVFGPQELDVSVDFDTPQKTESSRSEKGDGLLQAATASKG